LSCSLLLLFLLYSHHLPTKSSLSSIPSLCLAQAAFLPLISRRSSFLTPVVSLRPFLAKDQVCSVVLLEDNATHSTHAPTLTPPSSSLLAVYRCLFCFKISSTRALKPSTSLNPSSPESRSLALCRSGSCGAEYLAAFLGILPCPFHGVGADDC
jgi:hypothetical protein